MKCSDCPEYEVCRKYDLRKVRPRCKKSRTPKAFTNADKIRSMTDEELAEFWKDVREKDIKTAL